MMPADQWGASGFDMIREDQDCMQGLRRLSLNRTKQTNGNSLVARFSNVIQGLFGAPAMACAA